MGEENGTIEALLCYVINLSVFFIRPIGLKFTMIFSDHSHATSVGEGIGMLAFVLCLVGVVHYLNQANDHYMEEEANDHYMEEKQLYTMLFSSPFQIYDYVGIVPPSKPLSPVASYPSSPVASCPPSASHPPSSSTSSRPPSSSTPSYPPSSSTHSKPPSSSTSSKPSSSPTPSYPPPSSTVAYDHQSTSSSSSFSYPPPPPPPPGKVKPPTYVVRGDFARMVSDVSLRSEDFRLGVSGDSDIDNKAGRFITETKEKRKLEVRKTVGIEPLNKSCNKENAPSEEKKKNRVKQRRSEDEDEVVSRRRRSCLTKKKTRRRRRTE